MIKYLFLIILFNTGATLVFSYEKNALSPSIMKYASKYNNSILGKRVFLFDPAMNMDEIQNLLDTLHVHQTDKESEFTNNRFALLFKPGKYNLDIKVGYYMQVLGLGKSPEDVVINGSVRSLSRHGHMLTNFWRGAENLTIVPSEDSTNTWGVSQAAPLRRIHVKGNLNLTDKGYASGGFMANCKIDGVVKSGAQQQWFTRNTEMGSWKGGVWNMMFLGVENAPKGDWPEYPYTVLETTPEIREKPFWIATDKTFQLKLPGLKVNARNYNWNNKCEDDSLISIDEFYIANPNSDNATSLNAALGAGKNILFTPGIYSLTESLKVNRERAILYGLGLATLIPVEGNMAIEVADVDGVTLAGLIIDTAEKTSPTLVQVGPPNTNLNHANNPTFLYDLFFRVGGAHIGRALNCLEINSNNVYADHLWLWRADHGKGVGWNINTCPNGLIVNGNDVTVYGLFNEHFQEYQTIWNGENGRVYFYQCEMPYDPPKAEEWKHGDTCGYAAYKVADDVKQHQAWGLGIYNVFFDAPIIVDQAIETPTGVEKSFHHKVIVWLNGNKGSKVKSIINGKGNEVNSSNKRATMK
nr:coagulation factor 5/8 type domain-containing protein [uncultured Draconibacterium sp.]